jgi:hypothetical protein
MNLDQAITYIGASSEGIEKSTQEIFAKLMEFHPAEIADIIEGLRLMSLKHTEDLISQTDNVKASFQRASERLCGKDIKR